MLILDDYVKNLEYEHNNTKQISQNEIRNKYDESNLMFIQTGNRMIGDSITMMFFKNHQLEICFFDNLDEDFSDVFPIAYSVNYDKQKNNNKYSFYECGWGSLLYVDKKIDKKFYDELIRLAKENEVEFYNGLPYENFIHSYWITIAKKIVNN